MALFKKLFMDQTRKGPTCRVMDAKSETDEETNKRYTTYTIKIGHRNKNWEVHHRYNEFHTLHEELKNAFPDIQLKFPGKRLFGNFDPKFVERRRAGLDSFVQQITSNNHLLERPSVREFFQFEQASQTEEQVEDRVNLGPSESPHAKPSDFDYLRVIGKGSFGKVYVARRRADGTVYAVKVLLKAQIKRRNEVRHIMSERNVLVKNIQHPFLVELHYSFQTKEKLYFVMTYVNGGEIFFHLQREKIFSEPRARFYAGEIGSALGYLHEKNIIYRDLKPENLLLDSAGHVVLTDFGLCKGGVTGKETTSTFCGTPEYLAPEVIRKQAYDRTVDWWCLGCVLYEMLFGLPPFYSKDHKEMYERILYQPLRVRNTVSQPARDILFSMLQKDRSMRMGAKSDYAEFQSHSFFREIDWEALYARKIEPPFRPRITGLLDFGNIDQDFLKDPVSDSVGKSIGCSARTADGDFDGFTFAPIGEIGEEDL